MTLDQAQKEELKHCKDCLKVLLQPVMVELVKDYDAVVARYKDRIELLSKE